MEKHARDASLVVVGAVVRYTGALIGPNAIAQAHGLPEAKVKAVILGGAGGCGGAIIGATAAARSEAKGRVDDKATRWRTMIGVVVIIGGCLAVTACVGGRWRCHADHIGAADQAGEGIVAGDGRRGRHYRAALIQQGHSDASQRRFTAIHQPIVVIVFPDVVADAQFIETKVNRLVAIGVDAGQVAAIAAFAAANGWFVAGR